MRGLIRSVLISLGLLALGASVPSQADVITLTFDTLQDQEKILNYYNGGAGDKGSGPGPNYGITFSASAQAIESGNYANNPSPPGVLFFLGGGGAVMNVAAGFTTGFSFFYSAADPAHPGSVTVYDGVDQTGNILASLALPVTPTLPPGSPPYNNWVPIGVTFNGIAKSVNFSGAANFIGFDNVTLGAALPPGAVPEPSSLALAGLGCLGVAGFLARRRRATSPAA